MSSTVSRQGGRPEGIAEGRGQVTKPHQGIIGHDKVRGASRCSTGTLPRESNHSPRRSLIPPALAPSAWASGASGDPQAAPNARKASPTRSFSLHLPSAYRSATSIAVRLQRCPSTGSRCAGSKGDREQTQLALAHLAPQELQHRRWVGAGEPLGFCHVVTPSPASARIRLATLRFVSGSVEFFARKTSICREHAESISLALPVRCLLPQTTCAIPSPERPTLRPGSSAWYPRRSARRSQSLAR